MQMPPALLTFAASLAALAPAVDTASWVPAADGGAGLQFGIEEARPRKQHRLGQPDGDWICKACGNSNFANRVACNMKKCGALRGASRQDWQCTACGNVNFADRMFCNMRQCGASRISAGVHSDENVVILRPQQPSPQSTGGPAGAGPPAPSSGACDTPGSSKQWPEGFAKADGICTAIPTQGPVQMQKLAHIRQPLPQLPMVPPQQVREAQQLLQQDALSETASPAPRAAPGPGRTCAETQAHIPALARPAEHSCGKGALTDPKRGAKKGAWRCSCWHINFKHSAFCKNCGLVRVLEEWLCSECSNMNFADRAFCNMRKCMSPRKDVEPTVLNELFCKGLGKKRRR